MSEIFSRSVVSWEMWRRVLVESIFGGVVVLCSDVELYSSPTNHYATYSRHYTRLRPRRKIKWTHLTTRRHISQETTLQPKMSVSWTTPLIDSVTSSEAFYFNEDLPFLNKKISTTILSPFYSFTIPIEREREGRDNYPSNKGVTSLIGQTVRLLLFANTLTRSTNQSNYAYRQYIIVSQL